MLCFYKVLDRFNHNQLAVFLYFMWLNAINWPSKTAPLFDYQYIW